MSEKDSNESSPEKGQKISYTTNVGAKALEVDNTQKSELEHDLAEFNKPSRIRSLDEVTRNITYWENDQQTKNMIFAFNRLQPADVTPFPKFQKYSKNLPQPNKIPKNNSAAPQRRRRGAIPIQTHPHHQHFLFCNKFPNFRDPVSLQRPRVQLQG
jgi:hypothetical protein